MTLSREYQVAEEAQGPNWVKRLVHQDVFVVVFVFAVFSAIINSSFLTVGNIANLLTQSALLGILAIAQFTVVVSGGFDLSVAAIMALSSLVFASNIQLGVFPAAVLAIACGGACGLLNGLVITRGKVQPLIATLAMMGIARGLALTISEKSILVRDPLVTTLRRFDFGILTVPTIVWLLIAAVSIWWFAASRQALHIYAVGGNETTARLAGVDVRKVKLCVYTASGILGGIAGVVLVTRSSSGVPLGGIGWELDTIAAIAIGGVNLFGGEGKLTRAIAGVLIYQMIANVMNLSGLDPFYQDVVRAAVIITAVGFSIWRQRGSGRRIIQGRAK